MVDSCVLRIWPAIATPDHTSVVIHFSNYRLLFTLPADTNGRHCIGLEQRSIDVEFWWFFSFFLRALRTFCVLSGPFRHSFYFSSISPRTSARVRQHNALMCKLYGHREYFSVQMMLLVDGVSRMRIRLGKRLGWIIGGARAKQTNDKGFEDPMVLIVISVRTGVSFSVCQNK